MALETLSTGEFCFPPEIATSKGAISPPEPSNHLTLDSSTFYMFSEQV